MTKKTAADAEEPDKNKNFSFNFGGNSYTINVTGTGGGGGGGGYTVTASGGGAGGSSAQVAYALSSTTPILFGSWIKETVDLQEEFYKPGLRELPQKELEDWMRTNVLAAEDELHEALAEISWKPWAKSEFFNREAFIGEIVDVLHFVANMLGAANCTDAELNAAYLEKMERNRERQRQGYTGLDKCTNCNRAADDVTAHGGYMKMWSTRGYSVDGKPYGPEDTYGCNHCYGEDGDEYK